MKRRQTLPLALILILLSGFIFVQQAAADSRLPQVYYTTPTAEANGNIYYIVQSGDNCARIAVINGITEQQLNELNGLTGDDCQFLQIGRKLLIAMVTPTPTTAPQVQPTSLLPSPTAFKGFAQVCVYLFDDVNGNALPEETEESIAGGAVSVSDRLGSVSLTGTTTDDGKPVCFQDIPEGDYNVSVAPPQGYNPTTRLNYALTVRAGDQSTLDFGAQLSSQAQPAGSDEPGSTSPLLAIIGGVVLLGGLGLAIYARRISR